MVDFDEYQQRTKKTVKFSKAVAPVYCLLGLASEVGEVMGVAKRVLRGDSLHTFSLSQEIGDVLWYMAQLCSSLGLSLGTIAEDNLKKLEDRKKRGVIKGKGDYR